MILVSQTILYSRLPDLVQRHWRWPVLGSASEGMYAGGDAMGAGCRSVVILRPCTITYSLDQRLGL